MANAHGFRVHRELGRGASGRVLEVSHPAAPHRRLALKELYLNGLSQDDRRQAIVRFKREVEVARCLDHPGLVRVYEAGVGANGALWYTMDLLAGVCVETALKAGPMAPEKALRVAIELLGALEVMHRRGFVHRDIKPGNVVLHRCGEGQRAVLVDFGIARILDPQELGVTCNSQLTRDGFLGTPEYAAPEQCQGLPVDRRADLYAVGTVLYRLLSGRLPFTSKNRLGFLAQKVVATPLPLSQAMPRGGVAPLTARAVAALEPLLSRILSQSPDGRPGSAAEMAVYLERVLETLYGGDTVACPVTPPPAPVASAPLIAPAIARRPVHFPGRLRGWAAAALVAGLVSVVVPLLGLGTPGEAPALDEIQASATPASPIRTTAPATGSDPGADEEEGTPSEGDAAEEEAGSGEAPVLEPNVDPLPPDLEELIRGAQGPLPPREIPGDPGWVDPPPPSPDASAGSVALREGPHDRWERDPDLWQGEGPRNLGAGR